jgi:hypothetical protein
MGDWADGGGDRDQGTYRKQDEPGRARKTDEAEDLQGWAGPASSTKLNSWCPSPARGPGPSSTRNIEAPESATHRRIDRFQFPPPLGIGLTWPGHAGHWPDGTALGQPVCPATTPSTMKPDIHPWPTGTCIYIIFLESNLFS